MRLMIMEKIKVEGYDVVVERAEDKFVASVPELPGCAVQIDSKEDAPRAISQMIGLYLRELASKRPRKKRGQDGDNKRKAKKPLRRP